MEKILLTNLKDVLMQLEQSRAFFLSEDDLKFAFFNMLVQAQLTTFKNVRLEKNFRLMYKNDSYQLAKKTEAGLYVDGYLKQEKIGFELKYKTADANLVDDNEAIQLKNQNARDTARFSIRNDIHRLEKLIELKELKKGFVLFITNDSNYWEQNDDDKNMDGEYRFSTRILKNAFWNYKNMEKHGYSLVEGQYYHKNKKHWTHGDMYNRKLDLSREYKCIWEDYAILNGLNGQFRYLLIEI